MGSQQKKLILAIVLLVVAGGVFWYVHRKPDILPSTTKWVCVASGEVFTYDREDSPNTIPGPHPKTQQFSLVPVVERDGRLCLSEHDRRLLKDPKFMALNKYINPETLEVLDAPLP